MRRMAVTWVRALAIALMVAGASAVAVHAGQPPVLRPFVRGSWTRLRQSHAGRPLLVHFWGITCPPCIGELPKWGALQRAHPEATVIFVAADPEPVNPDDVAAAIVKARIDSAEQWMFADEFTERLRFEVSPEWAGEMPYTMLITPAGQVSTLAGVADMATLERWLSSHRAGR